ncbi:MAG: penicillin-binding protein activator [Proteobacteria bacterium]|nr:penicillin-binding protein activator [Pseudomonadota bacterium]
MKIYKEKSHDTQVSLIQILTSEAEKFVWQGNFQDALFIYNQALIHAQETEKQDLLARIETVLQKTSAKDIEEFRQIKNIQIPEPLLLYWLGINYGLENNVDESKKILESFLYLYPDHPHAMDARELVQIISKSFFNKDTIGCLLPLSGKYAIFGHRALYGIQLAIQELSKKYSRQFKLIVKDTKADPIVAAQCVRELQLKNVAGIIGPLLAEKEAGDEAQNLKIPMIAMTQKNDFPLQGDYLFANFITPEMQVKTLGNYLFGNLGIKKAAILYPREKYGQIYMNLFWDMADEYGVQIVGVESYDISSTDFTLPIQKLTGVALPLPDFLQIQKKPLLDSEVDVDDLNTTDEQAEEELENLDQINEEKKDEKIVIDFEVLFIPDSPAKVKLILPQLAFNDATGMYLAGTNLWHDKSLLTDAKGYNKQAVITDGFFDGSQNPLTLEFTKKFTALFGEPPQFLEAIAYDTALIMFTAAMDDAVDSRSSLRDLLKSENFFDGVTGSTAFDENGVAQRDLFLITIKKGQFVEISQ